MSSLPYASLQVHEFYGIRFSKDPNLGAPCLRRPHNCKAQLHERRLPPYSPLANKLKAMERGNEERSLFDRLALAWEILFPKKKKAASNADIAKRRLKMILISDRLSVNQEAKRKIVANIVGALSDFVEIESEDGVKLDVLADPDLGTVYSVSVPVRRVRPEFQGDVDEFSDSDFKDALAGRIRDDVHGLFLAPRQIRGQAPDFLFVKDDFSE